MRAAFLFSRYAKKFDFTVIAVVRFLGRNTKMVQMTIKGLRKAPLLVLVT